MSIEQENLNNVAQSKDEGDLEQYGVWVKKNPEKKEAEPTMQSDAQPSDSELFTDDGIFEDLIDNADERTSMGDGESETIDIDIDEYMPAESSSETDEIIDEAPLDIDLSFADEENFEDIKPDFPEESTDSFAADSEEIVLDESDTDINFDDIEDMGSIDDIVVSGEGENTDDIGSISENFPEEQIEAVDLSSFDDDVGSLTAENKADTQLSETAEETVYNMEVFADDEDETAMQTEEHISSAQTTDAAMLEKIMNELSSLREDISRLKTDVDSLKSSQNADTVCTEDKKSASGFFSDVEDDDTIALSGDELNNILTSADFTAEELNSEIPSNILDETAEASETGNIGMENAEKTELEESRLDDINLDIGGEKADEELPDEIAIPKTEDIVVDSSTEDFFAAEEDAAKEIDEAAINFLSEEPADEGKQAAFDTDGEETQTAESETAFENEKDIPSETEETAKIGGEEAACETGDDTAAESSGEAEETEEEEDLTQYSPVDQVFNSKQWQPEGEISTETDESISPNMREEIKSVLAYMDQLLENLPEEKIIEFAQSEQFPLYKKLFNELGLS